MTEYSDAFLEALAAWQQGWGDNWRRKLDVQAQLKAALVEQELPKAALTVNTPCYRKRFLIPNNVINGGDFWPLFWDGEIQEGPASWSTDPEFLIHGHFKKELRVGQIPTVFSCQPTPDQVILNVSALYADEVFRADSDAYVLAGKANSGAMKIIGDAQSEVILAAPVSIDRVTAIAGPVPTPEHLATILNLDEKYADKISDLMVQANLTPGTPMWIRGEGVDRAVDRTVHAIKDRLDVLGIHPD